MQRLCRPDDRAAKGGVAMTAQVPDSITVDGRRWVIEEWDGERDCIPANESLGFRTVSPATNNWRGRIDHFLIWHDRLLLLIFPK